MMMEAFYKSIQKPSDWPCNERERRIDALCEAMQKFDSNPCEHTRIELVSLCADYDFNQLSSIGRHEITEYEAIQINTLYFFSYCRNFNTLRASLYNLIDEASLLHLLAHRMNVKGSCSVIAESFERYLVGALRFYYIIYQNYLSEPSCSLCSFIVKSVKTTFKQIKSPKERLRFAHDYVVLLNDLSLAETGKRSRHRRFTREELKQLIQLEIELIDETKQNPTERFLGATLMIQFSNWILRSRNDYDSEYICKYASQQDAMSMVESGRLFMRDISLLNDKREGCRLEELFKQTEWTGYSWVKGLVLQRFEKYYLSSFSKVADNNEAKVKYGGTVLGYKGDYVVDLIGSIVYKRMDECLARDMNINRKVPVLSQVTVLDVAYDIEQVRDDICFLCNIIDLFNVNDEKKRMFLEEILRYWFLSFKDEKWSGEKERRYVVFLSADEDLGDSYYEEPFFKVRTDLFKRPDFVLGGGFQLNEILYSSVRDKLRNFGSRVPFICKICCSIEYDLPVSAKICPICGSPLISTSEFLKQQE